MARPSVISVEDKFRLVLSVVSGEMTVAEAARRGEGDEQSISNWKRQFLEGGKAGPRRRRPARLEPASGSGSRTRSRS